MKRLNRIPVVILWIYIIGVWNSNALAQDIDFTQYYLNVATSNAAFTGVEDYIDIKAGFRQSWNDFNVKNSSLYLSGYGIISKVNRVTVSNNTLRTSNPLAYKQMLSDEKLRRKHGLGGMVTNKEFGPYQALSINLNYAYHIPVTSKLNLSFGTRLGYGSQQINFTGFTVRDDINDTFYQQLLRSSQGTQNSFIVDFGSLLYSNDFYMGLSTIDFIINDINSDNLTTQTKETRFNLQTAFNLNAGSHLTLNPGVKLSYSKNYDILWAANTRLRYKEVIYIGSAFDSQKKLSLLFGLNLNDRLGLHYSYDQYLSDLKEFNSSMHEIILSASFFKKYGVKSKFW